YSAGRSSDGSRCPSSSPSSVAIARHVRLDEDDEVEGEPHQDDEVPVDREAAEVEELLLHDRADERVDEEERGLAGRREDVEHVVADAGPDDGAVGGVAAPVAEVREDEALDGEAGRAGEG